MKSMQKAVCAFSAVAVGLASVAPFTLSAGAIDPSETVTISEYTIEQILSHDLEYYYLNSNGEYISDTYSYETSSWDVRNCDASGTSNRDDVLVYGITKPSNATGSVIVPLNLHFKDVSYISFDVYFCRANSDYQAGNISLSTAQQDCYVVAGDVESDIQRISPKVTSQYLPAYCTLDGDPSIVIHVEVEQSTPTSDFYIGDIVSSFVTNTRSGKWWFGISDIIINAGYSYAGRGVPPSTPSTTTTNNGSTVNVGGVVSGTMVSGSSGWDVNYTIDVTVPDYHNDINPPLNSTQAAVQTELSQNAANLHSDENALLTSAIADIQLGSLPMSEYDPDEFQDSEPIFSFWNINLISVMLSWVGIIAFVSYILFGKWV